VKLFTVVIPVVITVVISIRRSLLIHRSLPLVLVITLIKALFGPELGHNFWHCLKQPYKR